MLELIATADLITDIQVLLMLMQTRHIAWTTIAILSMISPFLACQIPYLTFLKDKAHDSKSCSTRLLGLLMVSPFMLIIMTLMDLIFLLNSVIIVPIISLLELMMCKRVQLKCVKNFVDDTYEHIFFMTKIDAAGFRRMRTISQMTFETVIQVLL